MVCSGSATSINKQLSNGVYAYIRHPACGAEAVAFYQHTEDLCAFLCIKFVHMLSSVGLL
jgi:hypothetical protein